ncbi:Gfo/Idh/MocA family protein [Streptomyces sp. NPDC017993]|uniref:Gfo/Idh/MocA family protein n=1 Tax=Streptomyces sp. NPDC017993 TaxID=3365027 RepID=UPI0037B83FB7
MAERAKAPNPPLRIGVLGCAEIARRRMLPAFDAVPGAVVTAVAARNAGRAAELAARHGCHPVTGYAALLARPDVDAVYVPLPVSLHAPWVEAALLAGKHVLAEKPLSEDPATTRRLLALAESRGLVLRENVMFVHHPQHAAVRQLVRDGAIGELRAFSASFAVPPLPADDIRYAPELGGGALLDIGIYPVGAAVHFLGDRLTVTGAVLRHGDDPHRGAVETSGAALLHTDDGLSAQLTFGMDHSYRSAYELWGSRGRIRVERAFTLPADHHPAVRLERDGRSEEIRLAPADQVILAVTDFVAACRTGTPAADAVLRRAELLDGIRRADRRRLTPLTTHAVEGRT